MKLSELKKGDMAVIQKIDTDDMTKSRLASFGVTKGSELSVEAYSIANKTIEILTDGTLMKFGLNSKSFISLVIGFGRTVPIYIGTCSTSFYLPQ